MSEKSVLFVEDDEDDKELTLIQFKEAGFEPKVVWVRNGLEALDFLRRCLRGESPLPGLLLSDVKMPKMTGLELLRQVRANPIWARIPFVFMTSSGDCRDKGAAEKLGAALFLEKPGTFEGYKRVVEQLKEALG